VKITLPRDQILDAVSWAARVLPARPTSPLLACPWNPAQPHLPAGDAEFQAAFTPAYLLGGLGALGTDTACICFTGPAKPAALTGEARSPMRGSRALGPQPGCHYMVMPIRPHGAEQEEQ
jgi:DNA polymerase III sliding clamp (beta) subunit (PCNA family)